jgi:hypothetical protein
MPREETMFGRGRTLFSRNLVVDAFDMKIHAEDLPVVQMGAAIWRRFAPRA